MAQAHKDYSATPLPKKLGIRQGARVHVAGAPEGFDDALGALPTDMERLGRAGTAMDVVVVFVTEERDLRSLVDNKSASITEEFQGLQFVYRRKDRPR